MKPIDMLTGGLHSENIEKKKCNSCGLTLQSSNLKTIIEGTKTFKGGIFKDEISEREYQISGFCQVCQDSVFG